MWSDGCTKVLGCGLSLVHPQKLWVHHCAPAGDSARPASSSGLASVCEIGWAAGHGVMSPMGCTPWCIRPRLRRMVGQSTSSLAGSLCEALSEGTVELWMRSLNLEDSVIHGGRLPPACHTHICRAFGRLHSLLNFPTYACFKFPLILSICEELAISCFPARAGSSASGARGQVRLRE